MSNHPEREAVLRAVRVLADAYALYLVDMNGIPFEKADRAARDYEVSILTELARTWAIEDTTVPLLLADDPEPPYESWQFGLSYPPVIVESPLHIAWRERQPHREAAFALLEGRGR